MIGIVATLKVQDGKGPELEAVFAEDISKTTARTNEIQQRIGELATEPAEKQVLAEIVGFIEIGELAPDVVHEHLG